MSCGLARRREDLEGPRGFLDRLDPRRRLLGPNNDAHLNPRGAFDLTSLHPAQ